MTDQLAAAPATTSASAKDTDEDKLLRLLGFLGYGEPGAADLIGWRSMTPLARNWFHAALMARDDDPAGRVDAATVTPIQLAAFAWFRMNMVRVQRGLDIIRPKSDKFLLGTKSRPGILGDLLIELDGVENAVKLIDDATANADAILASTPDARFRPPLDEGFFKHKNTRRAVERIRQSDESDLDDVFGPGMELEQYL